jgi:S-DNA-T family DNA segregation ATPase FtsK/SpoIIIE
MSSKKENNSPSANSSNRSLIGLLIILLSAALLVAFVSFFYYWKEDQSILSTFTNRNELANNWLGKIGAFVSDLLIFKGFGIASFLFVKILFTTGLYILLNISMFKLKRIWFWDLYAVLVLSVFFGFFANHIPELGGVVGYEMNIFLQDFIGPVGTSILLVFGVLIYIVYKLKVSIDYIRDYLKEKSQALKADLSELKSKKIDKSLDEDFDHQELTGSFSDQNSSITDETQDGKIVQPHKKSVLTIEEENLAEPFLKTNHFEINKEELKPTIQHASEITLPKDRALEVTVDKAVEETIEPEVVEKIDELIVEKPMEEAMLQVNLAEKLVKDFGEFDHKLDLPHFKFPPLDLLKDYPDAGITINQEELEENKNKIVETLRNYKIEIAQIKATIGPSVTLYEIIPEAGIRISKIKSLEDDIALSLSALGIRIIAPMPGKGTIGIEVPNKKPTIVPMKSVISSSKFQQAEMELPIAFGKTISNETFVVDLAKMPHLLMAGATGQGKSVGLNAVLTSLLYKKHPAEVKFVLVDPKKVELTLFNKIERHYLAKLPNNEEAIITDNTKVINTLNSLCIEMDDRYNLLKDAMVRNIKEYNEKFKNRKLNPLEGHRYLPYIVLVVDEFADLIMTAGKEVETPIARLAQLARAIGIHLIIATQRPSVNVITGIIKANFPARVAFRVSSKIDSRTILDAGGADQLIGRGDLLYTNGNDLVRVQCAFVDTPEVEKIVDFIGGQKAYPDAYLLPEYQGEESGTNLDIDLSERDSMFREAAEVIITAQQGSASLLQRKLKLGYNRAGRLIDQLEAAGIVGPFEGSKARSVNFTDLNSLNDYLNKEQL